MQAETYRIENEGEILSPALIYYADRIRENTRRTIEIAGGAERLWPHVKSHKMRAMLEMQMEMGVRRFKCATLAEAEMAAEAGAAHVLLAYPLVGPAIAAFVSLVQKYPAVQFYALADDRGALCALDRKPRSKTPRSAFCRCQHGHEPHRRGNRAAVRFHPRHRPAAGAALQRPALLRRHVHTADLLEREAEVAEMVAAIADALDRLEAVGTEIPAIIAGGSPSFPCHAANPTFSLAGHGVFVDAGYSAAYPDLPFTPAAAVLTRVVSHPADGIFTLDLGCKGIASDPAGPRGVVAGLEHAEALFQSEEHWTYRMLPGHEAERPAIGAAFYVIPTHICPTTALYSAALVAENGRITGRWTVDARR